MRKIGSKLVALVVGAGMALSVGTTNLANAGDVTLHQLEEIRRDTLTWSNTSKAYDLEIQNKKQREAQEEYNRYHQSTEQITRIENNYPVPQVKEFYAYNKSEGWGNKDQTNFKEGDEIIFGVDFQDRTIVSESLEIIDIKTKQSVFNKSRAPRSSECTYYPNVVEGLQLKKGNYEAILHVNGINHNFSYAFTVE